MGKNYQEDPEKSVYVATYQDFDGSNYTLAGLDVKFADSKDGSASFFIGGGTDIGSKQYEFVSDFKGKLNYNDVFNMNGRIRTKVGSKDGETTQCCQFRLSPLSADIPVGKNTSIYINPYYKMQTDLHGDTKHSVGAFTGLSQKFSDNVSGFVELEHYNLQNINSWRANTSCNIGCRIKF